MEYYKLEPVGNCKGEQLRLTFFLFKILIRWADDIDILGLESFKVPVIQQNISTFFLWGVKLVIN